jgi:hypothetical protein
VAPLDAPATATATAVVDVEPAEDRAARDFGLELGGDTGRADRAATVGARGGQRGVEGLVDLVRWRGRAVAVPAVSGPRLAPGFLRLGLRRPFGERGGLTSGLPAGGVEFGAGLVELALEAFVVPAELLVVPTELLVVPTEVFE